MRQYDADGRPWCDECGDEGDDTFSHGGGCLAGPETLAEWRLSHIERALSALHAPSTDHPAGSDPYCLGCWQAGGEDGAPSYPCPTVQAIENSR